MSTLKDLDRVEPLFDAQTVRDSVAALGRRLDEEIGGDDPILLALLGGSVIFLADLVRAVERPLRFEFIDVALRTGASAGSDARSELVRIHYPIPVDLAGQSLLVLKDVVSSAVTEPYLEQQLRDRGARDVRFAALIDVPEARKTGFNPDYRALEAPRGGILVGYGLKHEGRYGNLPFVGRLSGEA
jgi:hypoxanthine phosphoribosyltransferase